MVFYLYFTLMVGLEYAAAMILMFSVFKFNHRGQYMKISSICVLMSQISYALCVLGWLEVIPVAAVIVWTLCMWLLFRLRLAHALIVTVCTYLAFALIQGSLILTHMLLIERGVLSGPIMDLISLSSASLALWASYYVRIRNWGFTFVPEGGDLAAPGRDHNNMRFLLVLVMAMTGFVIAYAFTILYENIESFLAAVLLLLPTIGMLLYLLWVKEVQKYAGKLPVIVPKHELRSGE
ncbi:hypothetical protein DUZ99_11955 [Xylanibacillus composti]|uniref:Uncharacterized protein n=1 Tax=Xylanibacillus composti TaxID=1572762 RepID=A0A8J4H7F6_9BACL|nr:hypothetical protein [Xylanibacillus composti]MDT9725687.1 hypothetical protein [Xylanibacillus composti]GIQ71172.1 hypothetical protein XYCOK13_39960 [Xylanibacillus composti]